MDENRIFKNNNRIFQNDRDRMQQNLDDMTASKMKTIDQFQRQQFLENDAANADGFLDITEQKDSFYMTNRVKGNVLMIDELLDNANTLNLTRAQKADLNIRRNRVKDFELLNNQSKSDSKEMEALKKELRQYDRALSAAPQSLEEFDSFCAKALEKCNDAINRCEDYLRRGKPILFWRSASNERYRLVEEAKARYLKDRQTIETLSQMGFVDLFLRNGDTMLDLMNLDMINERLVENDRAKKREAEERKRAEEEARQRAAEQQNQQEEQDQNQQEEQDQNQQEEQEQNQQEEQEQNQQEEQEQNQQEQQDQQQHNEERQQEEQDQNQQEEHQEEHQEEQQNLHQEEQQQLHQEQQQEVYGSQEIQQIQGFAETEEIKAVKTAITNIQAEMAKEMPAIKLTADKTLDMKAERHERKGEKGMDAFCVNMVRLFARLYQSITTCLKKENGEGYGGNEALKGILEQIREQTKVDRKMFRDKVVSYRSFIAGDEAEAAKKHSWFDAWKYARSASYDLDAQNNGFQTEITGAGSSKITKITDTKKKETIYFRKGENAGGYTPGVFIQSFMDSIQDDIKCEQNVKDELRKLFVNMVPINVMGDEEEADELIGLLGDIRYEGNQEQAMPQFIQSEICTNEFKTIYENASAEVKKELAKAVSLFARRFFQWSFSYHTALIEPEDSLTDRNVATSRLAGLLGISAMVSDSRTAVIKKDEKEIMGNVMEDSRGQEITRIEGEWSYSDKSISQLYTLQVFDILCGQIDRHFGNFHVTVKDHKVKSVKAIDNDLAFGNLKWNVIEGGYQRMGVLSETHILAMPVDVINKILSLDRDYLDELLGDILGKEYLDALEDRMKNIQKAIKDIANRGEAGLTIKNGVAKFEGEDSDDTLRMLKAVKKSREKAENRRYTKPNGGEGGVWKIEQVSLINWEHLTEEDLDQKIATARAAAEARNAQKAQLGGNQ